MLKVLLLWFGVTVLAGFALASASQYLITPIWLANVFAAFYSIKLRRYLHNYLLIGLLPFTAIFLAARLYDHHQYWVVQIILAALSALQVVIFVYIYYWLIKRITKFTYRRTVLLILPNLISSLICAFLFAFIPEEGIWELMFFDYFFEQIATGFSLVCILYGLSEYKKIQIKDYGLIGIALCSQYIVSVNQIFYHCFILPLFQVYFTIHYHFRTFVFVMGVMGLIYSSYLTLPLAGQYWAQDQIDTFSHLSAYRVGIASFIIVFLLLSELQMRHRGLTQYLIKVSFYDELTHLKNRRYMREKLLGEQKKINNGAALLIDIDDFKQIDDRYGHHIGDSVLQQIAKKIQQTVNCESTIFRWGGEEFLIILPMITSIDELHVQSQQIIDACKTTFEIEQIRIPCSVSMGVKPFSTLELGNYHKILEEVDVLLYQAKNKGKARYILQ